MDHALGGTRNLVPGLNIYSLNPCFNGPCSRRYQLRLSTRNRNGCLNPCFNGPCSRSHPFKVMAGHYAVLILVLMDHALGVLKEASKDANVSLS